MSVVPTSQRPRRQAERESVQSKRKLPLPGLIVAVVVFTALLVVVGRFCSSAATIDVTVNGTAMSLHGSKTLDKAIRESGWPVNPGDFISLDGVVLERGKGNPFYATVNGEETLDRDRALNNGDEIYLTDGKDIVEDYDSWDETIPCGSLVLGVGAICTFEEGTPKIVEHRVGRVSGAEVDLLKQAEERMVAQWHAPDVGGDKVLALTFDCGPSSEYTNQILDALAENNVKATFFCTGENAKANPSLVQREQSEGHQVASNTYDRMINEKTNTDKVRSEVQTGFQAIDDVLAKTPSSQQADQQSGGLFGQQGQQVSSQASSSNQAAHVIRFPNALLTTAMAPIVAEEADAVIGWDLDTADWMGVGADSIYEVLMQAEPGDIVVMHDGEYDCSATAAALRRALPELKNRGYSFITINELMSYPAKSEE